MNRKLGLTGLVLCIACALGAGNILPASATTGGHLVSPLGHAEINGSESVVHTTHFTEEKLGGSITCTNTIYGGTMSAQKVTELVFGASYKECHFKQEPANTVTVTMNGCSYVLTFRPEPEFKHNTVDLECEGMSSIEVHMNVCTLTIPEQTGRNGVTYSTVVTNGKHALTATVTITNITVQRHGGVCVFLGTSGIGSLTGSVTIAGQNTAGEPLDITAT